MSVEYLNGQKNSAWAQIGPLGSYEPETALDMAVEPIYPFVPPPLNPASGLTGPIIAKLGAQKARIGLQKRLWRATAALIWAKTPPQRTESLCCGRHGASQPPDRHAVRLFCYFGPFSCREQKGRLQKLACLGARFFFLYRRSTLEIFGPSFPTD